MSRLDWAAVRHVSRNSTQFLERPSYFSVLCSFVRSGAMKMILQIQIRPLGEDYSLVPQARASQLGGHLLLRVRLHSFYKGVWS